MLKKLLFTLATLSGLMLTPAVNASSEGAEEGASGGPIYHEITPPFVVNLQDGKRMRFMQIKVQAMAHDSAVVDAIEKNLPPIRHSMIMLLTDQSLETMRSVQGREQVRKDALDAIRQVLADKAGVEGPEALYFTDFVIQ